jgi:hypothetical protein
MHEWKYVCMHACMYVYWNVGHSICMNACMCACSFVCMHEWSFVCMYACMHVYWNEGHNICMNACMWVCIYACMFIEMKLKACVWMHVCMYECMHVCMVLFVQSWTEAKTLCPIQITPSVHTYMHACIHIRMHTCIQTANQGRWASSSSSCDREWNPKHVHTCIHTYTHTYIHPELPIRAAEPRPLIRAIVNGSQNIMPYGEDSFSQMQAACKFISLSLSLCVCVCVYIYIHICIHTYICAYIHETLCPTKKMHSATCKRLVRLSLLYVSVSRMAAFHRSESESPRWHAHTYEYNHMHAHKYKCHLILHTLVAQLPTGVSLSLQGCTYIWI